MKGYGNRRVERRLAYKILVIVCEGEKTERIYFNRFRKRGCGLKIETPNSRVTDPINLVKFANRQIDKFDLNFNNGDKIWCIFDADNTTNEKIDQAIKIADKNLKIALSNPSFEIWYLLHYEFHKNPLSSDLLLSRLNAHISNYRKNMDVYDILIDKIQRAINNSKKLNQIHVEKNVSLLSIKSNPSTQVHEIVEHIFNITGCKI